MLWNFKKRKWMKDEIVELNSSSFIELNFQENEKVKISPVGDVVGVDGRTYKIDGNAVVANTTSRGIDIVLNKNHWGSEAYGWFPISSLEIKSDGIYASLEPNNLGDDAIKNRHWRYLSPEFMVDRERNVTRIVGVGLVNQPNLLNKALNREEQPQTETIESEEDNNMAKTVEGLEKEVNTLQNSNDEKDKTISSLTDQLKETKVDNAIASGILLPNQKDFAITLEVNQLDSYLATLKPQQKNNQQLQENLDVNNQEQGGEQKGDNEVWQQLGISQNDNGGEK